MFSGDYNESRCVKKTKRKREGTERARRGTTTVEARARGTHPEFQNVVRLFEEGIPSLEESGESWGLHVMQFCAEAMRSLCSVIDEGSINVDKALALECAATMEEFRIENDSHLVMRRPIEKAKMNLATICWTVRLHLLCVAHRMHQREDDRGEEALSFAPSESASLRSDLLVVSHKDVSEYTHGEIEYAYTALTISLRDVKKPDQDLVRYCKALEFRIARLSIFPSTDRVFDCVLKRRCVETGTAPQSSSLSARSSAAQRLYTLNAPTLTKYAAFFSSFRTRMSRYVHLEAMETLVDAEGETTRGRREDPFLWGEGSSRDPRFLRFREFVLGKARMVCTPEFMQELNRKLTYAEYDLSVETLSRYECEPYGETKDLQRRSLPWPAFRAMLDVVNYDRMEETLNGARNVADVMLNKHAVFGDSTWRNDLVVVKYVSMLFENGLFSRTKPNWERSFVFLERAPLPNEISRMNPLLVQNFGRFDVLHRDRVYRTRDAFAAAFLWCRIVWEDKRYNGTVLGIRLNPAVFDKVFRGAR